MNRTKWLAVVAMAVALPALAQERWRGDWERERGRDFREQPVRIEKRRMEWMMGRMDRQLSELQDRARGGDRRTINILRDELNDLREMLNNAQVLGPPSLPQPPGPPQPMPPQQPPYQQPPYQQPPVVQPPPPAQPVVGPMPERSFRQLMDAMARESFPNDRLRVLGQAAPTNWFLVQQVQEILGRFDFPADRLKAMRTLRGRILDTNNFYQLYGAFEFPRDKEELKRILGQ